MRAKKVITISLATLISLAITLFLVVTFVQAKKVNTSLDLGNKYLSESNYEEAIIAFEKLIKIDSKNAKAYKGLVEVYIAKNDYEKVVETYIRAKDNVKDKEADEFNKKLENLTDTIIVEDCVLNVQKDDEVILPNKVQVTINNVDSQFTVQWEKTDIDTSEIGTIEIKGTVNIIDKTTNLIINIEGSAQPEELIQIVSKDILRDLNAKLSLLGRAKGFYTSLFSRDNYNEEDILRVVYNYLNFNHIYCPEYSNYILRDGGSYNKLPAKTANEISQELFGVKITEKTYEGPNPNASIPLINGNFEFMEASGSMVTQFTYADSIIDNKDGTYTINFTNYEFDISNSAGYTEDVITNYQMFNNRSNTLEPSKYKVIDKGTALVELKTVNDKEVFTFVEYN